MTMASIPTLPRRQMNFTTYTLAHFTASAIFIKTVVVTEGSDCTTLHDLMCSANKRGVLITVPVHYLHVCAYHVHGLLDSDFNLTNFLWVNKINVRHLYIYIYYAIKICIFEPITNYSAHQ